MKMPSTLFKSIPNAPQNGQGVGNVGQPQPNAQNPMQMLSQLKADPMQFLRQAGYTIPQGMNSPNQIIQHLLQSGQVPFNRYQQIMRRR